MSDVKAAAAVAKGDGKDVLDLMRRRFKIANEAYADTRENELDDLRFKAASPDHPEWQWPQDVLSARGAVQGQTINARPSLVMNKLPQHVFQITNDQRQNRPAGKVIPVDDKADIEVAEIFNGMVRHIEYLSDADVAYDTACDHQVTFGEGYIRLLTDYVDEMSFDQDIKIGRVKNAFSVYMDPMIQDPCGSDAQWCLITEDMSKDEFEKNWPKATPISDLRDMGVGDEDLAIWLDNETVKIAEYFYYEEKKATLKFWPGMSHPVLADSEEDQMAQLALGAQGIVPKSRETVTKQVKWIKTNGYEILESGDWAGKWIPVVRVIGNEYEINGEIHLSGIVRNAKDAQRMYNYWCSQEAEMLALAPKAPFIGYGGQFDGYEDKWKNANINNYPYLEVNPDVMDAQGTPLPKPERAAPPMASSGLLQAKMGAADDIKGTTGQYDPSLGAKSNETSGKAIVAREKQADTGTYHYVDNLARAIRHLTRQIIDLIPKIYDTKRVARIIGEDGEPDHVEIDPGQQRPVTKITDVNGGVIKKIYNLGIGEYDVRATVGPSYMTKRQENVQNLVELSQGIQDPQVGLLLRYFTVKNMDFPDAQEFSNAIKKLLPPGLVESGEDDSPEMAQAKQMIGQLQQQVQQMGQIIEDFPNQIETLKAENDHYKADIDAYRAETDRLAALAPAMTPEDVQSIVLKTLQEALSAQPLEQEEPIGLEQNEMHMQGPPPHMPPSEPPPGGFFTPEGM